MNLCIALWQSVPIVRLILCPVCLISTFSADDRTPSLLHTSTAHADWRCCWTSATNPPCLMTFFTCMNFQCTDVHSWFSGKRNCLLLLDTSLKVRSDTFVHNLVSKLLDSVNLGPDFSWVQVSDSLVCCQTLCICSSEIPLQLSPENIHSLLCSSTCVCYSA